MFCCSVMFAYKPSIWKITMLKVSLFPMENQMWSSPLITSWTYLFLPFEGKIFRNLSEYEISVLQSRELYVSFLGNKCQDSRDVIISLSFVNALKLKYYIISKIYYKCFIIEIR